ncbi:TIGR03089 family protein [Cellulomonas sp. MW9]|uniref:TIGR03089 family protein n=1 Tax=Cellulomonas edaphi TaxID=3053468 RepID=A0ABT7S804_9CELL|nr:TIGR03089 family protein [Cellulomons edaphi]
MAALLSQLTREPGRPRITWYGADFERVELSGAVLDNWVSKTTNLLVEEFDAAPGVRVLVDLPPHWRTLVWALAVWRTGAHLVLDGAADVVVTDRPADHPGPAVVAVSLPALARRFDGELPRGAVDAAAAVMTYGDAIGWLPPTDPAALALDGVAYVELGTWWRAADDARVAVDAGTDTGAFLATVVGALAADGSVVAISPARRRALRGCPRQLDATTFQYSVDLGRYVPAGPVAIQRAPGMTASGTSAPTVYTEQPASIQSATSAFVRSETFGSTASEAEYCTPSEPRRRTVRSAVDAAGSRGRLHATTVVVT